MTEVRRRKVHSPAFKAMVALEALRGERTVNEIAGQHSIHPVMVSQWKKEVLTHAHVLFETKRGPKAD